MIKELRPTIVRKIWGGKKLELLKGLQSCASEEPIGETWEIYESHLPYLAKFIDTSDELSIQVHPYDDYARLHENSSGKTECWIILEASAGAGIYLGLRPHVTKDVLKESLLTRKPINELLNFYPVKKGDFFYVPAGSIHAIGRDITLAEVQQNSGITYRVWDWNRLDEKGNSRELHVEKSLDVINFEAASNELNFFRHKENLFSHQGLSEICSHRDFHLFLLNLEQGKVFRKDLDLLRPCSILNLNGRISIDGVSVDPYAAVTIEDIDQLRIEALEEGSLLLIF
ncbi:MAG: pirin family protein [Bacteriovorax sp.]